MSNTFRPCNIKPEQLHPIREQAIDQFEFSHCTYHRKLKLARIITNLASPKYPEIIYFSESIAYIKPERTY